MPDAGGGSNPGAADDASADDASVAGGLLGAAEAPAGGLLGAADVRAIAARMGVRPTKFLGQNFVIDPNTVRRIVRVAAVGRDDIVVEVGPGLGSLTLGMLPAVRRVVAVEIDPTLAAALEETVSARLPAYRDRLDVIAADALTLPGVPGPAPTAAVANLPYNVAVPLLLWIFERLPAVRHGLVLVQDEVAERLCAPAGSRVYGVPSVKAAWYAELRRAGSVSRTVFWPAPRVDSGLVAFRRRPPPTAADRPAVFAVVDAAFAQRRKTLRAALAGWAGGAAAAQEVLRTAGVDPGARGESLALTDFVRIAAARRATAQPGPTGDLGGSSG